MVYQIKDRLITLLYSLFFFINGNDFPCISVHFQGTVLDVKAARGARI